MEESTLQKVIIIFLLPKTITQCYSPQGIYQEKEWRSITSNCPNNGRCLVPKCDSIWYTCLHSQHLCVWGFFFPFCGCSWLQAVGRADLKGWSGEAGFEASHRVTTCSGTNTWGWSSLGQASTLLMLQTGLPDFWLASKPRAATLQSHFLWQTVFVMHLNHLLEYSSKKTEVNAQHYKSK